MTKLQSENSPETFEIVSTKFNADVSLDEQTKAMNTLNEFIGKLEGFKSRNYYYSEKEGQWVDFIIWKDEPSATAASEEIMKIPEVGKVFSMLDMQATSFSHYQRVGELKSDGMQW